ncbi:MAG: sulfite exporter TauE/SafE family protein [Mariprofundus sp.]|nr:sulfite exporter TauE/SafE family protein [Mariprofundus sp.]
MPEFNLIGAAFLVGFLGSMHCVGMCGGLITTLSMSRSRIWWPGLMGYQAGRIATYTLLGLLAGMLGMALAQTTWFAGAQQGLTILAGLLMIIFGLALAGWLPDPLVRGMSKVTAAIGLSGWIHAASSSRMPMSWFMVGLFNGLLPCGLVYAGLALSLTAGHLALAAAMMFAFGLGTVPAMTVVPWVLKSASPTMRGYVLKVAAVLLIGLGLLTMLRGGEWMHSLHGDGHSMAPTESSMPQATDQPMHHGH